MSIFDDAYKKLLSKFSDWITIDDNQSNWTIEDFPYETGVNEDLTKPHCWKCVTVNKCWFKNEKGKKPEEYDPYGPPNLYHPNCHCNKLGMATPLQSKIKLIITNGKIEWMIKAKIPTVLNAMGYKESDKDEILQLVYTLARKSYEDGDYEIRDHNKFGVAITLFYNFPGKNEDAGKTYRLKSGWMVFPNGKIKANTLIGGFVK